MVFARRRQKRENHLPVPQGTPLPEKVTTRPEEPKEDYMVFVQENVYLRMVGHAVTWVLDIKQATRFSGSDILLLPLPFQLAREIRNAKCHRVNGNVLGSIVSIVLPENSKQPKRNDRRRK